MIERGTDSTEWRILSPDEDESLAIEDDLFDEDEDGSEDEDDEDLGDGHAAARG